jgi:hypothetical protein
MAVRLCRLLPTAVSGLSFTANGRVYTAASATTPVDNVPVFDGAIAEAAGWLRIGLWSGPTSARPTSRDPDLIGSVLVGTEFYDQTLATLIKLDAAGSWRNAAGAVV